MDNYEVVLSKIKYVLSCGNAKKRVVHAKNVSFMHRELKCEAK